MNNFEERMLCDYLLKVKDKINFCTVAFEEFYLDLKKQLNLSESEFPIYLIKPLLIPSSTDGIDTLNISIVSAISIIAFDGSSKS